MAREVIHRLYRQGEWQGLPWQDVEPYQLLARLLYLNKIGEDDFLEAIERGEWEFSFEGRFDPARWLQVSPQAALLEPLDLPPISVAPGVRESWWVGLFFYQLPWEWYRLVKASEREIKDGYLLGLAPFLCQVWRTWYDMEIVRGQYADSFYPAVAWGWSERHQRQLEALARDYLGDYQMPAWWSALQAEGQMPFGAGFTTLGEKERRVSAVIERAFSWLVKFVSVPYEAWSLHWVLLEVMTVFRRLQQDWQGWLRRQGEPS